MGAILGDVPFRAPLFQIATVATHRNLYSAASNRAAAFSARAAAAAAAASGASSDGGELEQRSEEWHNVRRDRLTASTFSSALGLFKGKRVALWEEKLELRKAFAGNSATRWGVDNEGAAVERYKRFTGHLVDHLGFKVSKDDDWLGASPDGLIEGNESGLFDSKGVLEVKCPHLKGRRRSGIPWGAVPHYYVPQAQGLLEIMDREWMDFFVWTTSCAACFRVQRDRSYWSLIREVLSDFWWNNVVPAREAIRAGACCCEADMKAFKPAAVHPHTDDVYKRSKELSKTYPLLWSCTGENKRLPVQPGLSLTLSILSDDVAAATAQTAEELEEAAAATTATADEQEEAAPDSGA